MSTPQRQALIVEGGGMRGAFTAGVLDAFLEKQFNPFDLYVGVSSGSTNLANYLVVNTVARFSFISIILCVQNLSAINAF